MAAVRKSTTRNKKFSVSFLSFKNLRKNIAKIYSKNPLAYKGGLIAVVIIIVLAVALWFNKGLLVAGTINGQIITTPKFYNRLVETSGNDTFDSLVQETLLKQEASKRHVTATKDDIDKKVAKIEKSLGGKENLDAALIQNKTTMNQLRRNLEIQVLVEKILADQIKVTDAEITKYIEDNKASSPDITREEAKQQLESQKLKEKFTPWYNELKSKAKINRYF